MRAVRIQREAACEAARTALEQVFAQALEETLEARLARAAAIFGSLGFGRADVSALGAP